MHPVDFDNTPRKPDRTFAVTATSLPSISTPGRRCFSEPFALSGIPWINGHGAVTRAGRGAHAFWERSRKQAYHYADNNLAHRPI